MTPNSPTESTDRFTKIYFSLWGICILIAAVALILYQLGYRLTNQLQPVKVGSIELTSNENNLQIFLNNREKKVSFQNNLYVLKNITPGLHSLIVSKEGYWPWTKNILVTENNVRSLYAFLFPIAGITTKKLTPGGTEYSNAIRALKESKLPEVKPETVPLKPDESLVAWLDRNVPLRKMSKDKTTALYIEDNTAYVAWVSETEPPPHYFCFENPCKLKMPVIIPSETIKSIDFYKGRRDVIVFSAKATIYVIEVDREGTQNFQPIYNGNDPYFYETNSNTLYIKDGSDLFSAAF